LSEKQQRKKAAQIAQNKKRANNKKKADEIRGKQEKIKKNNRRLKGDVGGASPKVNRSIEEKRRHGEFGGILIVALSILTGLSVYFKGLTGLFGEVILHVTTGMTGYIAYLLPPLLFAYGFLHIFYPARPQIKNKTILMFLLLLLIGAIFQAGAYEKNDYVNMSVFQYLKSFYRTGRSIANIPYTISAGVLGGLVCIPLCLVFQKTGTIIVLGTFSILLAMMITEISLKNTVVKTVGHIKNFHPPRLAGENYGENEAYESNEADEFDSDVDRPVFLKELDEPADRGNIQKKANKARIIDFPVERNSDKDKAEFQGELSSEQAPLENIPVQVSPIENIPVQVREKKTAGKREKSEENAADIRIKPMQGSEYQFPPFSCMDAPPDGGLNTRKIKASAIENARKLEETLLSFGISAQVINVAVGPAFTRFELQPSPGVRVSRIVNLADDIALSLEAQGIRIEAPIPGKAAVGVEVPNKEVMPILLREVLETPDFVKFKSRLAVGLGKDISGENIIIDLARMPHLLIAGATGSGKSVCINSIVVSLLYKATPEEVKLLMIDPKVVELGVYNGIPHLLIPVVTDPSKAAGALQWAVQEMVTRYKLFAQKGVRDITGYNKAVDSEGEGGFRLPQIVIIIDELADLMMVAPHDVEDSICRLAQMARAAGMHLVIATQRPSVNVITGVIKANIPSRISFAVSSQVDSRTILDMGGAEKLLGKGDMLYYPVGLPKPIRVKGAFVSDKEVEQVVEYVKNQVTAQYDEDIIDRIAAANEGNEEAEMDADELLPQAIELIVDCGQASVSLIQRRFKVGYARAGRIVDQMAERGIISGFEGSKPRRVLITKEQWEEMKMGSTNNS